MRQRWYVCTDIDGDSSIPVIAHGIFFGPGGVEFYDDRQEVRGRVQVAVRRVTSFYAYHSFAVIWHDEDYDPRQHPDL